MNFEAAFDFLKKLSKNNNREWFEKNKPKYLDIKADFETFVADLYEGMLEFDESLAGQNPKKLMFRIYRDVRFSKDKRPYKKNISAAFSSAGKGMARPGYYLHIEPGDKSFIGIGLYSPIPETLQKVRQEIDYNGDNLKQILTDKKFKKYFPALWNEDTLKTSPKGYDKDHPYMAWLKLKSFIVTHSFPDTMVKSKKFKTQVLTMMKEGKRLNDFLGEAMG